MNPGPYRVIVPPTAQRQLHRLPAKVVPAVIEFMTGPLADEPHRVGKELRAPLDGLRSARRGTYRVIYRIDHDTVVVVRIDHRSNVYRT